MPIKLLSQIARQNLHYRSRRCLPKYHLEPISLYWSKCLKKYVIISLWFLALSRPAFGIEASRWVVEASPSDLMLGKLGVRVESAIARDWRIYSQLSHFSADKRGELGPTQLDRIEIGPQFYPKIFETHGPYIGVGIAVSNSRADFQRLRPSRSYFQPAQNDEYDRWTTTSRSLGMRQAIGYRIMINQFLTTSLECGVAENLYRNVTLVEDSILPGYSPNEDQSPIIETSFLLNFGFTIH